MKEWSLFIGGKRSSKSVMCAVNNAYSDCFKFTITVQKLWKADLRYIGCTSAGSATFRASLVGGLLRFWITDVFCASKLTRNWRLVDEISFPSSTSENSFINYRYAQRMDNWRHNLWGHKTKLAFRQQWLTQLDVIKLSPLRKMEVACLQAEAVLIINMEEKCRAATTVVGTVTRRDSQFSSQP